MHSSQRNIRLVQAETIKETWPDIRLPVDADFCPDNDLIVIILYKKDAERRNHNSFTLVRTPNYSGEKTFRYMVAYYEAGWEPMNGDTRESLTPYYLASGSDPFEILQARYFAIVKDRGNLQIDLDCCKMERLRKSYDFVKNPISRSRPILRLFGS